MAYTVRVNGFEVICEKLDEVRALVGSPIPSGNERHSPSGDSGQVLLPADHALLKALVAAEEGVPSTVVQSLLGSHGKGMPGAIERWEERIGLPHGALEKTIVNRGVRGWKLTAAAMAAAKVILTT